MAHHAPRPSNAQPAQAGASIVVPRSHWFRLSTALTAFAGVIVILSGGATAVHADPSVTEIERQIDADWNQLEPIIERHNLARQNLADRQREVSALAAQIEPLELQVNLAMAKVGVLATRAYKGGNTAAFNAVIASRSRETFLGQLELLDQFARRQREDVQAVVDLRNQLAARKAPLEQKVAQLSRVEADLAARKKQINGEIDRLQKLRTRAYGNGAGGLLRPAPCPATYPGGSAAVAVRFACAQIGKAYVWGAAGPNSYDCSGLMLAAWEQANVTLPHNAARQRRVTAYVSRDELRPGDLVFYYADLHHVGMYVGDGWVVHAPQSGEPVRMRRYDLAPIHSFGRPA